MSSPPLTDAPAPAPEIHTLGLQVDDPLDLSIVVPVYNEVESVEELVAQVIASVREITARFELILVDDGSRDGTGELLKKISPGLAELRTIHLRRNFGQAAALAAGFDAARGRIVVTLDGDLQNEPRDIPKLLQKMNEGYDVVSGWRADRQDHFFSRRLPSVLANRLIARVTGVRLHDTGCSLKAYRAELLKDVHLYGEMHRFIPALASSQGGRIAEIPVSHHPRTRGKSKYGIMRTFRVILDLILVKFLLTYSTRPIHLFGLLGLGSLTGGTLICGLLAFRRLFEGVPLQNKPLLLLGVLLLMMGVQFITMGLIAEMQVRLYHESQSKPIYRIRETT
ncbi:MAG: glycosyltransferase family 2 protein [Gemmatimonadetes bacterium]|nr:glycosyltransferase family 2 protein [Gemmatimonadota bacterium]